MAISTVRTQRVTFKPLGAHRSLAVDGDVDTLTVDEDNATLVMLQAETDDIRITLDGTAPNSGSSPTVGFVIVANDPPVLVDIERGVTVKYTQVTSAAVLQYQFGEGAG
jgi:hypothetical protein